METIRIKDINFESLHKINAKYHLEGNLFHDNQKAYKIFKKTSRYTMAKKERKIELLHDGQKLPNVIMPIEKITNNRSSFKGYTMRYVRNSIPLYDIKRITDDPKLLFQIIATVSKTVQKIHTDPRHIMIGDMNFNNIVIDRNLNPYFIDFDSCKIDGLENENIPAILSIYLQNRGIYQINTTKNSDRLSLLLSVLDVIFEKNIDLVTRSEYDRKAEHLKTLRNIRPLIIEIQKTNTIPEVPYIHELISQTDIPSSHNRPKTKQRIQF